MYYLLKYIQNTSLLVLLGLNTVASASNGIEAAFSQDVRIESNINGGQVINLSNHLKGKSTTDAADEIERIRYMGMNGQSHQLISNQLSALKSKATPKKHQLSAKISSAGSTGQFLLPEVGFKAGLIVLEWSKAEQAIEHKFTSTWLMNPNAGQQFADKRSQTLSIRPMINSRFLKVGNDLPVRLYYQMGAVSENLYAKSHGTGEIKKMTSDKVGMVSVKLNHVGLWTLMVERQEIDKKYTSFLNFEVVDTEAKHVDRKEGAPQ